MSSIKITPVRRKRGGGFAASTGIKRRKLTFLPVTTRKRINRMLSNVEKKYVNPSGSSATTLWTQAGSIHTLNAISQGDTASARTGANLFMTRIEGQCFVSGTDAASPPASIGAFAGVVRTMIFYDKQTNGSAPSVSDVLVSASALASQNPLRAKRFKVLYDVTQPLGSINLVPNFGIARWKFDLPLNLPVQYTGTGGAVSDISTGGLFLLMICQTNGTQANNPAGTYNFTVHYTDD